MTIGVKDILELKKNHPNAALNLFYSSSQYLTKGIMLASIKEVEKSTVLHRSELLFPSRFTA
jgi:hypothetical protein